MGLAAVLLTSCAMHSPRGPDVAALPPLHTADGRSLSPVDALAMVKTPDLLRLDDAMRDFVDRYVTGDQRQRLHTLHRSLISAALVDIDYDPAADGTAREVFHDGAANCLSYAHLFVALARYAGLDANYLSVSLRPEWSRHGRQVALRQHVSVNVRLRNGASYVIDIDPVSRERIASTDLLSDEQAYALYHGNLAMDGLLVQDMKAAYAQALKAVQMAPDIDYLWVNLGAIYRQSGQDAVAENLYQTALSINPYSRTAMNNLAVLYSVQGDEQRAQYWADRVQQRRQQNPFYHYSLGEMAEADGNLESALAHYRRAIALRDSESEFYFRVARLYAELDDFGQSRDFAEKAIQRAKLVVEREQYRAFLRQLSAETLAAAPLA